MSRSTSVACRRFLAQWDLLPTQQRETKLLQLLAKHAHELSYVLLATRDTISDCNSQQAGVWIVEWPSIEQLVQITNNSSRGRPAIRFHTRRQVLSWGTLYPTLSTALKTYSLDSEALILEVCSFDHVIVSKVFLVSAGGVRVADDMRLTLHTVGV